MKITKHHIAIAIALVVVGFTFFPSLLQMIEDPQNSSAPKPLSINLSSSSLSLPLSDFNNENVAEEAWITFQNYLEAAKAHDLEKLRTLSHQLSPACADRAQVEECYELMDSFVFFAESLKQINFVNIASDSRQTVLSTNFITMEGAQEPIRTVIYFTRDDSGNHKVLGLRFCFEDTENVCVETRPNERDRNSNGWWDDVEALFR